jgi:hypothetical protein
MYLRPQFTAELSCGVLETEKPGAVFVKRLPVDDNESKKLSDSLASMLGLELKDFYSSTVQAAADSAKAADMM